MDLKISDKAFNLAKEWVKNMTGGEEIDDAGGGDNSDLKADGRPARLGLGAEYTPHSQLTSTMNPVEKKLREKLNASKGVTPSAGTKPFKVRHVSDKSNQATSMNDNGDDDDDEGGRASAFKRKHKTDISKALLLEPANGKKKRRKS